MNTLIYSIVMLIVSISTTAGASQEEDEYRAAIAVIQSHPQGREVMRITNNKLHFIGADGLQENVSNLAWFVRGPNPQIYFYSSSKIMEKLKRLRGEEITPEQAKGAVTAAIAEEMLHARDWILMPQKYKKAYAIVHEIKERGDSTSGFTESDIEALAVPNMHCIYTETKAFYYKQALFGNTPLGNNPTMFKSAKQKVATSCKNKNAPAHQIDDAVEKARVSRDFDAFMNSGAQVKAHMHDAFRKQILDGGAKIHPAGHESAYGRSLD